MSNKMNVWFSSPGLPGDIEAGTFIACHPPGIDAAHDEPKQFPPNLQAYPEPVPYGHEYHERYPQDLGSLDPGLSPAFSQKIIKMQSLDNVISPLKKMIFEKPLKLSNLNSIPTALPGNILTPTQHNTLPLTSQAVMKSILFNNTTSNNLHYNIWGPEVLPELALSVLEYMDEVQPHVVIGCDRGGRLFGLALHAAWRQTRSGQSFPTLDGKIHFARVSSSVDPEVLQERIDQIIAGSHEVGAHRGKTVLPDEQLRVMFVDEWIGLGRTMTLAAELMEKHGALTYFAVMSGEGADVSGTARKCTQASWEDFPEELGINYLPEEFTDPDSIHLQQKAVAARHPLAGLARQAIYNAALALPRVIP